MDRIWIGLGGLAGAVAVAMAAAVAHGSIGWLDPDAVRQMQAAVQINGWHALALLATGLWSRRGGRLAHAAGAAFALGLLLFCAAIYALALAGVSLGPAAPAGGLLLILGWLLLGASSLTARRVVRRD